MLQQTFIVSCGEGNLLDVFPWYFIVLCRRHRCSEINKKKYESRTNQKRTPSK